MFYPGRAACCRNCFGLLIFLCSIFSLNSVSHAGLISPELGDIVAAGRPSGEIQVIINLADKADISSFRDKDKKQRRQKIVSGLRARAELSQRPLHSFLNRTAAKRIKSLWIKNAVAATIPADLVPVIAGLPGVESVVLDSVISAPVVQAGAAVAAEWNIDRINAPALWAAGITGSGVVVANMDTGVHVTHPDLLASYRGGTNSWYDPYTPSTLPYDQAGGSSGHGTGTMGVMVGGDAGGTSLGVAPGAQWIAAKLFDDFGSANTSDVHAAFQWLIDPDGNPVTADAPDIVNASWGYRDDPGACITEFEPDIAALKTAGIALIFSAGNAGPNPATSVSPANNAGAFAVGATDISNTIASFSSRGPSACGGSFFPHVVAPGVNIRLASLGGCPAGSCDYTTGSGTSFAAPHVSGAMALLLSAFPSLTPAELETALQQTAINIGAPVTVPNVTYGYGLIDVSAALTYLTTHGNISVPEMPGFPAAFDYGYVETTVQSSETFTVTNRSGSNLTVNSVTITGADAADFSISANSCLDMILPASGSCTFTITVESTTAGPKNAAININYGSTPADLSVPLSCTVVVPNSIGRFQGNTLVATYSVIQSAYNDCISSDVIRLRSLTWYESPDLNSGFDVDISLLGGYDTAFGYQSGFTTIKGTLTISSGSVTIGNIILE
ncbi:MAG: hypothetical protein C0402_01685 [Thermodesulfovibrio sp.]|nr:hypothetical protein [Thermodesulfovibrio sp.]